MKTAIGLFVFLAILAQPVLAIPIVPGGHGLGMETRAAYAASNDPIICIVTTTDGGITGLTDSSRNGVPVKEGTLRDCIDFKPPADTGKIVLFEVSGIIAPATDSLKLENPYNIIAGQTAPSPGILVRHAQMLVGDRQDKPGELAHDTLVQHLRFRVGDDPSGMVGTSRDSLNVYSDNVVLDHVSISWALDENTGMGGHNMTYYRSIVAEPLRNPTDNCDPSLENHAYEDGSEAEHPLNALKSEDYVDLRQDVAFVESILAHGARRNPDIYDPDVGLFMGNTITYNWERGVIASKGYALTFYSNMWISGLDTNSGTYPIIASGYPAKVYMDGGNLAVVSQACGGGCEFNHDEVVEPGQTQDWALVYDKAPDKYCAGPGEHDSGEPRECCTGLNEGTCHEELYADTPVLDIPGYTPIPTANNQAFNHVTAVAGARPEDRSLEGADERIISEILNHDDPALAGRIKDCVEDPPGSPDGIDAGGWPDLAENYRTLSLPSDPHGDQDSDGYTNLEEWLHSYSCVVEGPSSEACGDSQVPMCTEGQITSTCLCGGTEYSTGYCCSGSWQSSACTQTPDCSEGQITSTCLCGGTEYSTGYCCSDVWQSSACTQTGDYTIAKASSSPLVDGDCSEYYLDAETIHLDHTQGSTGADYRLLWDESGIYVCADVTDSIVQADHTERDSSLWEDDSMEIMFDTQNDKTPDRDENDFKFYLSPGNVQADGRYGTYGGFDWNGAWSSQVSVSGTLNNDADTDTGYTLEMGISFQDMGISAPSEGSRWGLEIKHNDKDVTTQWQAPIWSDSDGDGPNDPEGWGTAVLGSGQTPVGEIFSDEDSYLGDSGNWNPDVPSLWEVTEESGSLRLGIMSTDYTNKSGGRLGTLSLVRDREYNNFYINATVKSNEDFSGTGSADYCLVWGYEDEYNYYYAMLSQRDVNNDIFRILNGERVLLEDGVLGGFSIPDNLYHQVSLEKSGDSVRVLFDGSLVSEVSVSNMPEGRVGIGSFNDASFWDDIRLGIIHRADTSPEDGCIQTGETLSFVDLWYSDSTTYRMHEVTEAIRHWKQGDGC